MQSWGCKAIIESTSRKIASFCSSTPPSSGYSTAVLGDLLVAAAGNLHFPIDFIFLRLFHCLSRLCMLNNVSDFWPPMVINGPGPKVASTPLVLTGSVKHVLGKKCWPPIENLFPSWNGFSFALSTKADANLLATSEICKFVLESI